MNFTQITRSQFSLWKKYRRAVYRSIDDDFDEVEMDKIVCDDDWFCYFLTDDKKQHIGMIEMSSRNIVDGCLSSPVAYIEGLYIEEQHQGQGIGKQVIDTLHIWCRKKGFTEIAADTELDNVNAQKYFNAVGFKETYRVVEFCTKVK